MKRKNELRHNNVKTIEHYDLQCKNREHRETIKSIPFISQVNHMNYVSECLCKWFIALRLRTVKNWWIRRLGWSLLFNWFSRARQTNRFANIMPFNELFDPFYSVNYPKDRMITETNRTLRFKLLAHWFRRKRNSFHNVWLDTIQLFVHRQFRSFFTNVYSDATTSA